MCPNHVENFLDSRLLSSTSITERSEYTRLPENLPEFTGIFLDLPEFIRFLPEFTRIYHNFTRIYQSSPRITRILPDFNRIYKNL
jgi:hypothetical protein